MFQIFAQLIETRPAPLPAAYMAIFPPLLSPQFWERPGNVPALVRLLQARRIRHCAEFQAWSPAIRTGAYDQPWS